MSTAPNFRTSLIAEVGKILKMEGTEYHFVSVSFEDGTAGLTYGDQNAGPDDPYLKILPYLMTASEPVQYTARPNRAKDGTIVLIQLDRAKLPAMLAKYEAAAKGAAVHKNPDIIAPPSTKVEPPATKVEPPATKVEPPKSEHPGIIAPPTQHKGERPTPKQEVSFPPIPPDVQAKADAAAAVHPGVEDPYYGYPSRNAMLDAKDGYFRWLEKNKILRDAAQDREFSFRYFFEQALKIVLETGKKLAPADLADTAWPLAVELYNRFKSLNYNEHGQIVDVRREETTEPA